MGLIKQAIADADAKMIWEHRLPGVRASEEELATLEQSLGERLDPRYREFLSYAGGWPAFHQMIDLFGPRDLAGGERLANATRLLSYIEPIVFESSGLRRQDLLPIAASREDLDVFAIARRSAPEPGIVVWFAGTEIERYPNFDEYYLATMDYARQELEQLRSRLD